MKLYLDCRDPSFNEKFLTGDVTTLFTGFFSEDEENFPDSFIIDEKNDILLHSTCVGKQITISNPETLDKLTQSNFLSNIQYLLINTEDWKIIPLENIIANFQDTAISILAYADTLADLELLREVLEVGVDGVVISYKLYRKEHDYFHENSAPKHFELQELTVSSVNPTESGDRVCVDTVSILKPGEGLLVGCTSKLFTLVEAEVNDSGYINPRPFRVNAGPVSSYLLNTHGTNYLSELAAGSKVTIVSKDGKFRNELVARSKIERRPLILIQVNYNGKDYPLILQNAETVRVFCSKKSKSITELKKGDKILCSIQEKGRHYGMEIDEFIEEK